MDRRVKRASLSFARVSSFITLDLDSRNIFPLKFSRVCVHEVREGVVRIRGRRRRVEKLGGNVGALFLERASSEWKGDLQSPRSNESQSISRRVLVARSTSYNGYGFRSVSFSLATFAALMHTFLSRS